LIVPTLNSFTPNEVKPVLERAQRRRFSNADKLRIVKAADACAPGTLGAFMRREGIYSSQLYAWRKQRNRGELDPGAARNRAHATHQQEAQAKRITELERENRQLRRKLVRAELISEVQKKFAGLLGIDLASPETNESAD
jgi:transposase-like protein